MTEREEQWVEDYAMHCIFLGIIIPAILGEFDVKKLVSQQTELNRNRNLAYPSPSIS